MALIRAGSTHGERRRTSIPGLSVEAWLGRLARRGRDRRPSWRAPGSEQLARGYGHTLREIAPAAGHLDRDRHARRRPLPLLEAVLEEAGALGQGGRLVLTGSGSSLYAASAWPCPLQQALGVPVSAVAAGQLLTHPEASLPPSGPYAVVSRSRARATAPRAGRSSTLLLAEPRACHLDPHLQRPGDAGDRVRVRSPGCARVVLDEKTNDQSLVMTSSFTNMVLAGRAARRHEASAEALLRARAQTVARARGSRPAGVRRRAGAGGPARLLLRRVPGQRLPPGGRPRGEPQDARDERRPRLDPARVVPGPAPRADVGRARGHPGRGLPLLRSRWCGPTRPT